MKLVIALATRGRPKALLETLAITIPNIVRPDTVLMVCADDDDKDTIDALANSPLIDRIKLSIAPREDSVGAKFNRALAEPADVYLAAVDHTAHVTKGFDHRILSAAGLFPDGIGVVYNSLSNVNFPWINAVTAKLAEKMGYIYPTHFPYWFIDHWLDDIARIIDRIAVVDVVTDSGNRHYSTQELRESYWWATWFDALYPERRRIAQSIIRSDDFHEPAWRKQILLTHHPLIEFRSKCITGSLRKDAAKLDVVYNLSLRDTRYQRIKANAVAMIPEMLSQLPPHEAEAYRRELLPQWMAQCVS